MSRATARTRITLRDVARRAEVSHATASKVLNGRGDVSEQTRERVLRVISEIGYSPSVPRVASTRAPHIVAVFDDVTTQYAALILHGMLTAGTEVGVDLVVRGTSDAFTHTGATAARRAIDEISSARGLIAVTSAMSAAVLRAVEDAGLPLVTIDQVGGFDPEVVSVGGTNWAGGFAAAEHLLDLGHRSIGWVGGLSSSEPTIARFHGFQAALERAGIPARRDWYGNGAYTFDAGVELGGTLLDLPDRPTAVICGNDAIAFGVSEAARARRLELPSQLSVVGFDDIPQCTWTNPKLTSVRQPLIGMGRLAVSTILDMRAGRKLPSHHIELADTLIVRESTAPPPG